MDNNENEKFWTENFALYLMELGELSNKKIVKKYI